MKKIRFKYLLNLLSAVIIAITFSGCDLDEKFYSEVTPNTFITSPESAYAILSNPFTHWHSYMGKERWMLQELTADAFTCPQRGSGWYNGGEYFRLQYHTWTPDDRWVVYTYTNTTKGMAMVLEAKADLEKVDYNSIGLTDQDKADHIQQLEALGAFFYMKALDYFGGMPIYYSNSDPLKARNSDVETFEFIEKTLKEAIPNLKKKDVLSKHEDGYISRAAAAAMLAQLYLNAEAYTGKAMFEECEEICEDIIEGEYGVYKLDDTWWGPHGFDNDISPEIIWTLPSEYSKLEVDWHYKYFYHYNSYQYFDIKTTGNNGFMLTPSLKPTGEPYSEYKLGNTITKFHEQDLRKKPYCYLGNKQYEGMFLMGNQINPIKPSKVTMGSKEYKGKLITLVDQVARFSEVGPGKTYSSIEELPSTMADGEENSGFRLVKSPQPNLEEESLRYNPDWPVIRLAEIYYMLAECKMRAGKKAEAAQLVNQVRKRNFADETDPDPVTSTNLDEYRMLDEWLQEFIGEAAGRRRTDLIRWNMFTTQNWWEHKAHNDPDKRRFPIPYSAISANNLLEQNPGY